MPAMTDLAAQLQPLVLRSPAGRECRIDRPVFLAPMDGITDHCFRRLVVPLGGLGVVCSEFARISVAPLSRRGLRAVFGEAVPGVVNVLQLMAPDDAHLAESAARAAGLGVDLLDLNFGCPVKRVVNKCAGSALLAFPERMAAIVRCAVAAQPLPVTVKMRPGLDDAALLEDLLDAVAEAGACLIALHARLRRQAYGERPAWEVLARAAAHLHRHHPGLPLIGNGGIDHANDAVRMLAETGVDGLMIGQAALADPWIFREIAGGPPASVAEAWAFLREYAEINRGLMSSRAAAGRVKQAIKHWRAAGILDHAELRRQLLSLLEIDELLAAFAGCAQGS
jgi:tRNA-dihydrouridine synthase